MYVYVFLYAYIHVCIWVCMHVAELVVLLFQALVQTAASMKIRVGVPVFRRLEQGFSPGVQVFLNTAMGAAGPQQGSLEPGHSMLMSGNFMQGPWRKDFTSHTVVARVLINFILRYVEVSGTVGA